MQAEDGLRCCAEGCRGPSVQGSRNGYRRWSGCQADAHGEPREDSQLRSSDSRCLGE